MTNTTFTALIPTCESALYDAFGIDIFTDIAKDEDGHPTHDPEHIAWFEIGSFDRYAMDETDDLDWDAMMSDARDRALDEGWRVSFGEQTHHGDYIAYPIDQIAETIPAADDYERRMQ